MKITPRQCFDHPVAAALQQIAQELDAVITLRKQLAQAQHHAEITIPNKLNCYFSTCEQLNITPHYRIDMQNGTELTIDEHWFDLPPLDTVSLQSNPVTVNALASTAPLEITPTVERDTDQHPPHAQGPTSTVFPSTPCANASNTESSTVCNMGVSLFTINTTT